MPEKVDLPGGLKALGMTCTSTDCPSGLHYFRPKTVRGHSAKASGPAAPPLGAAAAATGGRDAAPRVPVPPRGPCRACGADLVDWDRVIRRDLSDMRHTFEALRKERIRHYFWHKEFDGRALRHARRKGRRGMWAAAEKRVRQSVGQDTGFDGRQTSVAGNALFYAQHATASCCRKCIEEWHAIERGRPLTDDEVAYLTELVRLYIAERMTFLTENGEKVPPFRRAAAEAARP